MLTYAFTRFLKVIFGIRTYTKFFQLYDFHSSNVNTEDSQEYVSLILYRTL